MQPVHACREEDDSMPSISIEPSKEPVRTGSEQSARTSASSRLLCGRYQLQTVIGRGAMGTVYRARDLRTGTLCAIKMLSQTQDEDAYLRFVTEATVIAQLFHPNIVEIHEFRRDELGAPFLVMELLTGVDLHTYIQYHKQIPLERTQEIIRQVASALHAIHCAGIVHRDVKAKNIFLAKKKSRDGTVKEEVKLVDFGLSKIIGHRQQQTAIGIILGTPEYLAPEATHGRSAMVDARADQWSLAAVAFRMLSGRLPFDDPDDDVIKLLVHIRSQPPPNLRELVQTLPAYAVSAIERALSKNKEDRFPSMLEFARAFCGQRASLHSLDHVGPITEVPLLVPRESTDPSPLPCLAEKTLPIDTTTLRELLERSSSELGTDRSGRSWADWKLTPRHRRIVLALLIAGAFVIGMLKLRQDHRGRSVAKEVSVPKQSRPPELTPQQPTIIDTPPVSPTARQITVAPLLITGTDNPTEKAAPAPVPQTSKAKHAARLVSIPAPSAAVVSPHVGSSPPIQTPKVVSPEPEVRAQLKPSSFQLEASTEAFLPPFENQSQPVLPAYVWQMLGAERVVTAFQICIRPDGGIASIQSKRPHPLIDPVVTKHVLSTWRFQPQSDTKCIYQAFEFEPRRRD